MTPTLRPGTVSVRVAPDATADTWRLAIVSRDRHGLLARITSVLADAGLDILSADITTSDDGTVDDTFVVRGTKRPSPRLLGEAIETSLRVALPQRIRPGAAVRFDNAASATHTMCMVEADDRPGLLAAVTAAFALAGVEVHTARIGGRSGAALDQFALSDAHGHQLDNVAMGRIRRALEGATPRR